MLLESWPQNKEISWRQNRAQGWIWIEIKKHSLHYTRICFKTHCLFFLPKSFCCSVLLPHSKAGSISDISSGIIHKLLDSGGLYFQDTEQEMQRSTSLGAECYQSQEWMLRATGNNVPQLSDRSAPRACNKPAVLCICVTLLLVC